MRKFAIAFLRNPNPSLHIHSHASLKRGPPHYLSFASTPDAVEVGPHISMGAFSTLASTPDAAEVGACKPHALPHISMGAFRCGSLHAEIPTSIAEARPTSAKAKKTAKAKATKLSDVGVFKPEAAILHEEEETAAQNAATGKAEEAALHVKLIFEEEKAVQNAAIERSEQESMLNVKKDFSEWVAKLDLNTFKRGRQWEEVAYQLLDHGISSPHVKKMLPRCRTLPCGKKSPDSILKHFTMLGMPHEEIGRMISLHPHTLNTSSKTFQSKVEFFESVGIGRRSLGKIMHSRTHGLSLSTLRGRCDFWKNYFQDVEENALHTLILRNPGILAYNLQKTVKPKIAYLEELGVSKKMLFKHSRILGLKPKVIAMKLKLFEQFGIPNGTSSIKALVVLHGLSALKIHARIHNLFALGFSFDQVQKMMFNFPQLLQYSEDDIKKRLSYAVNVMNLSFDALVAFPSFWGYSYEKRIKYRYEVLQELKTLGAYEKNISLSYMLCMTDADFSRKFIGRLQAYTKHPNI